MPSASLLRWQHDRVPRLAAVDAQCAASLTLVPAQSDLVEENLRGYVLLLSAHFQGYCRDLYTECAQQIVQRMRPTLRLLVQTQFTAHLKLDRGNPNLQNINGDFERFGFSPDLGSAAPGNPARLQDLASLNRWRNVAAHHSTVPVGTPALHLPLLQGWRNSCTRLATSLDLIMYNHLRRILRRSPW